MKTFGNTLALDPAEVLAVSIQRSPGLAGFSTQGTVILRNGTILPVSEDAARLLIAHFENQQTPEAPEQ